MDRQKVGMLQDPTMFSLASSRDVADRMVSGFLYGGIHSPLCAKKRGVVSETELVVEV